MNVKKQVIILFFLGFLSSSVAFATRDCGLLSLLRKIFSSKRSRLNRGVESREAVVLDRQQQEDYERISISNGEEEERVPEEDDSDDGAIWQEINQLHYENLERLGEIDADMDVLKAQHGI